MRTMNNVKNFLKCVLLYMCVVILHNLHTSYWLLFYCLCEHCRLFGDNVENGEIYY